MQHKEQLPGSPPLVRERLSASRPFVNCSRITPARAGKTSNLEVQTEVFEDHPRSCGKDYIKADARRVAWGSPPLVRERLTLLNQRRAQRRITPARAGKTSHKSLSQSATGDHPRSCGKDLQRSIHRPYFSGSPPLVRERPSTAFSMIGITWDHPRSCGKDSNGSLYLRHFAFAGIQNLFNFFKVSVLYNFYAILVAAKVSIHKDYIYSIIKSVL